MAGAPIRLIAPIALAAPAAATWCARRVDTDRRLRLWAFATRTIADRVAPVPVTGLTRSDPAPPGARWRSSCVSPGTAALAPCASRAPREPGVMGSGPPRCRSWRAVPWHRLSLSSGPSPPRARPAIEPRPRHGALAVLTTAGCDGARRGGPRPVSARLVGGCSWPRGADLADGTDPRGGRLLRRCSRRSPSSRSCTAPDRAQAPAPIAGRRHAPARATSMPHAPYVAGAWTVRGGPHRNPLTWTPNGCTSSSSNRATTFARGRARCARRTWPRPAPPRRKPSVGDRVVPASILGRLRAASSPPAGWAFPVFQPPRLPDGVRRHRRRRVADVV